MRAIVRDDIIKLESYVDAEFKYKKYIEILNDCGGYCFLEQFIKHFKNDGGRYLKDKMEASNLLNTEYFSNYKFVKLSSSSLKYLYYRDDEKDYSDVPKNKLFAKYLSPNPSSKVLYASVMNFELYHQTKKKFYLKSKHIQMLESNFKSKIYEKIDKIEQNIKDNQNPIPLWELFKEKFVLTPDEAKEKIKNNEPFATLEDYYDWDNEHKDEVDRHVKNNLRQHKILELKDEITRLDAIIDKIITIRDVSKLIITIEDDSLNVYLSYARFPITTSFKVVNDLLKLIESHNQESYFKIKINNINYNFCSIFNTEKIFKKNRTEILELFEKKSNYDGNIKFKYSELPELNNYGEVYVLKSYVNEKD